MKQFPKSIFIIRQNEGTNEEYFEVNTDIKFLPDESCRVALYELKNIKNLEVTKKLK